MTNSVQKVFGISLNSVAACAQVSALADGAVSAAIEFIARKLGDAPTFETYNALRIEWRVAYLEQRGLDVQASKTAGALDVAWLRNVLQPMKDEYAFEVPKSASKAATEKAATRKAKEDKIPGEVKAAQTLADLDKVDAPTPDVVLAVAEKRAAIIKADNKAKEDAARKAEREKLDGFVAFIKALPPVERDTFYALRDKRYGVVLATIPAVDIQNGLTMLGAVALAAKHDKPKGRKAPAKA